jgi:hypothetical protein
VGDKRTDNSNTVGPQYPQILPLRTQPTVDWKYLGGNASVLNMYRHFSCLYSLNNKYSMFLAIVNHLEMV